MHRVALITHDYFQSGGTRTMTQFLRHALERSAEFQPTIISVATSKDDENSVRLRSPVSWSKGVRITEEINNGVPVFRVGCWGAEIEPLRYRPNKQLTQLLSGFDIVQFVVGTPPWANLASEVKKPVFLWTATTLRPDRESRIRNSPLLRKAWMKLMTRCAERQEAKALERAGTVFALSDYTLSAVTSKVNREKVVLAPCGVDLTAFSPLVNSGRYILCAGRLADDRKNIPLLLEAYKKLVQANPEAPELWLVGPEPPRHVMSTLCEVQHRVKVLGKKSPLELAEIYRNAMFFALASDEEGLGIVLLEAMASGLPVVSTACGGPESIVVHGETGILVPTRDAARLCDAMSKLVADPALRKQMGSAGYIRVVEHFSEAVAAKPFLDCYRTALCGQKS